MKKIYLSLFFVAFLIACQKEEVKIDNISTEKASQRNYTIIPEGINAEGFTPILNYSANDVVWKAVLKSVTKGINFGVWIPYYGYGVPPFETLQSHGIIATWITGNIDAAVLENYDVIFIGRAGFLNNQLDIDALKSWIQSGGGIIGESETFISDTNNSSILSEIAGVSSTHPDGFDSFWINHEITISDVEHPITQGISNNFTLNSPMSTEVSAYADVSKNSSAVEIAKITLLPNEGNSAIVAANYGDGKSVYFPSAANIAHWDWNPEYQQLFINAVKWCAQPVAAPVIEVMIDIKPDDDRNVLNNNGNGKIPVAIFGTEDFDCNLIDLNSVSMQGMPVSQTKQGKFLAHAEDLNLDGYMDLILQFEDIAGTFTPETDTVTLTGDLTDGQHFQGSDSVLIVGKGKFISK